MPSLTIRPEDIAVVGLAGRFPGADTIEAFWENCCRGKETITHFSIEELAQFDIDRHLLADSNYIRSKGIINKVDQFDASFFGLSEQDAKLLDPQQRLFLLCAWEALENAGYPPKNTMASRVGVFASTGMSLYLIHNLLNNPELLQTVDEFQLLLGNDKDFLATRVSYLFNLTGPSINIQTGCSSSLVCIHYAVQSLLNGECDMAIAGGVSITIPQEQGYFYRKEMIGSADGHCYAFDKRAQGTVKSNGVGIVVLKPLSNAMEDNDHIYAVIRGSAVNNDGARKVGFTAPNASQQAEVIKEALYMAELTPGDIGYIEAHGTGTLLGDPIEIAALKQVFQLPGGDNQSCALASLKTNLGHLDVAAGVAGFIKACLSLYHQKIPASLNFSELNPKISLENTPFYINTVLRDWNIPDGSYRRAGISAFGVGGTNAHIVIQEPPHRKVSAGDLDGVRYFPFSAKSPSALQRGIHHFIDFIQKNSHLSLHDLAFTLQSCRVSMPYRTYVIAGSVEELLRHAKQLAFQTLLPVDRSPSVVFMFSGQGAQYPGMGSGLYTTNIHYRKALDEAMQAFLPYIDFDVSDLLLLASSTQENAERLKQTKVAQPALFIVEYALAKCYEACGIKPVALIGHSIGEYVAATIAGVFTLKDAALLIAARGKLVQQCETGKMFAVQADVNQLSSWLPESIDIALENAPNNTVIAGSLSDMMALELELKRREIRYHVLHTSHAFHSRLLDPILEQYKSILLTITLHSPKVPIMSNVTADWLTDDEARSVDYWVKQLRHPVKFFKGISSIQRHFSPVYIEVGPGRTLQTLLTQQGIQESTHSLRHPLEDMSDAFQWQQTLAELWKKGVSIHTQEKGNKIPLPTYNWDLSRCWVDGKKNFSSSDSKLSPKNSVSSTDLNLKEGIKNAWKHALGKGPISNDAHFFQMGGHSLAAIQFIEQLPADIRQHIEVHHIYQYPRFHQLLEFIELHIRELLPKTQTLSNLSYTETDLFSEEGEL